MCDFKGRTVEELLKEYPPCQLPEQKNTLRRALASFSGTVVVLDDDPTGTQTVFDVPVVTDWRVELLEEELQKKPRMLFVLTNSRALTAVQSEALHHELAQNLLAASQKCGQEILLVSRSDSTLRGHFPLETQTLRQELEAWDHRPVDGEIICPFFLEGGRFTAGNIHYLVDGGWLKPVGESEFASDKTFGYHHSHLGKWIEEKTGGAYREEDVLYITLEDLREQEPSAIRDKLSRVHDFGKIVVNAVSYEDLERFVPELLWAIQSGKRYILRTASSILRVLAGCEEGKILSREELVDRENSRGGIVLVGSHVRKTTQQLKCLLENSAAQPIEFNQHLVLDHEAFEEEIRRVSRAADERIRQGQTVVVFTRRERLDLNVADKEAELRLATAISDGIIQIISGLNVRPNFIIAKGGITSSDVATKGLCIRRASVMGQILPGIPVWRAGPESKFPGMPYVIFPGNVGSESSLLEAVEKLRPDAPEDTGK